MGGGTAWNRVANARGGMTSAITMTSAAGAVPHEFLLTEMVGDWLKGRSFNLADDGGVVLVNQAGAMLDPVKTFLQAACDKSEKRKVMAAPCVSAEDIEHTVPVTQCTT